MPAPLITWLAAGLVILGLVIMTVAVYGLFRMPDIYTWSCLSCSDR